MKKIMFFIAIIAIAFSSCKKYELSEDLTVDKTLGSFKTVTVSGVVTTEDFDKTDAPGKFDYVTSGTLTFYVENAEYGIPTPAASKNNEVTCQYFYATIGADGKYTVDIPVPTKEIEVNVTSHTLLHSCKESATVTREHNFVLKAGTTKFFVNPQTNMIQNFEFVKESDVLYNPENPNLNVTLSGKFEYVSKDWDPKISYNVTTTSWEYSSSKDTVAIPSGTNVKAEIEVSNFDGDIIHRSTTTVSVGANGAYSLQVPMVEGGKADVKFSGFKNLEYTLSEDTLDGTVVTTKNTKNTYRYELNVTANIFDMNRDKQDFLFVKGVKLD